MLKQRFLLWVIMSGLLGLSVYLRAEDEKKTKANISDRNLPILEQDYFDKLDLSNSPQGPQKIDGRTVDQSYQNIDSGTKAQLLDKCDSMKPDGAAWRKCYAEEKEKVRNDTEKKIKDVEERKEKPLQNITPNMDSLRDPDDE